MALPGNSSAPSTPDNTFVSIAASSSASPLHSRFEKAKKHYRHTIHNSSYYGKCLLAGGFSSVFRWILTPFDYIKCLMQANPQQVPSFRTGFLSVWKEQGAVGLFTGFTPTMIAYFTQSGTKYATYELIKENISTVVDPNCSSKIQSTFVYVISAGCAEAVADVLMCPWEMMKVKMQTSQCGAFPTAFGPAISSMFNRRHELNWPFGALTPLLSRQVMFTVANFVTYENVAPFIHHNLCSKTSSMSFSESSESLTSNLNHGASSFIAGLVSGTVSTVVSHPADSLLSLRARYPQKTIPQLIDSVCWIQLATKGLFPRAMLNGPIIASQWFLYDSFKNALGFGTHCTSHV